MSSFSSPFIGQIRDCKQSMRKLRKKIYKHCINKQKSKKQKDTTEEIIDIFKQRNVPAFVTETLKKRRSFDMTSIKNIVINSSLPLQELRNRVNLQEKEVDSLYFDHKKRMDEDRKKLGQNKHVRIPSLFFSQSNIYSSTNEDDLLGSLDENISISDLVHEEEQRAEFDFYDNLEEPSKGPLITDNYLNLNESSFNEDLGFLNF